MRRRARITNAGHIGRLQLIIVELSFLDRGHLGAFELVRVFLAVIEADQTSLLANALKYRVWLYDVVVLSIALDDRDLVVSSITVRDRGRMRGRGYEKGCHQGHREVPNGDHGSRPGSEAETRHFFFFAAFFAGFFAAFFAL